MKTHRLLFLLLPVLIFSSQAQAQNLIPNYLTAILHLHKTTTESPWPSALAKTTGVGSRLQSFCQLQNNGAAYVPKDSAFVTYSNERPGTVNLLNNVQNLKYDTAIGYSYNTTTSSYSNSLLTVQTFDANNNILTSIGLEWDTATNSYDNSYMNIYTYDANNNMLTDIEQIWASSQWSNSNKDTYTYDANNNMLTDTYQQWDGTNSVWDNETNNIYTYTAANKVSTYVYQGWNTATSQWDNSTQTTNSYDANNNLSSSIAQQWDGTNSVWDNHAKDIFTYDGNNDKLTDLNQTWSGTVWQNNTYVTYSSFVAQNPQNVITQEWNTTSSAWANTQEILLTYNSYNQESTIYTQAWNVGGFWEPTINDIGYRLHYETYTLGVNEISNNGGNAKIYPVPAHDVLNISLTWDEPQVANIAIYDVQGRVVDQWKTPTGTAYNNALSVSNLAEGTYFIKITGEKGRIVQKLVVSR